MPVGKLSKVAKILKIGEDGTKSAGRLAEELAELQKLILNLVKHYLALKHLSLLQLNQI
ncbi:hypothetical protein AB3548_04205 [Acinetobacter baumannii]